MHNITIFVDGVHRDFKLDYDGLINKNWNEVVEDIYDSAQV
jgi:hypothetical protein